MDDGSIPQAASSRIIALLKSCTPDELQFFEAVLSLSPEDRHTIHGLMKATTADKDGGHDGGLFDGESVRAYVASLPEDTRAWITRAMAHSEGEQPVAQVAGVGAEKDAWLWNADGGQR